MGGAVSSGRDNNELIDNLMGGNYIRTRAVERVFRVLDRADYMTPEARDQAYKDLAWRNGPLHLSAPCIYSEVMEGLMLKPGLTFLNIGSGTGYLSTLVGLILGSGGISHGVEVHPYVVDYANTKTRQFNENSVTLDEFDFCEPKFYCGNGLCLAPLLAPYDRVYCGAACPEEYQNYFKQLIKVGGVLVMPLNDNLIQVRRVSDTEWTTKTLLNVSFATLREPSKEEAADLIRLEEQGPPRLQVLSRAAIRAAMRGGLWRRHPELREPPARHPPAKRACPRRICIPIEDDSDVEGLNALHDLDPATGANEMNALLSLVLSMGQNRVAGALRLDPLESQSDSSTSSSSFEDEDDHDDEDDDDDDDGDGDDCDDDAGGAILDTAVIRGRVARTSSDTTANENTAPRSDAAEVPPEPTVESRVDDQGMVTLELRHEEGVAVRASVDSTVLRAEAQLVNLRRPDNCRANFPVPDEPFPPDSGSCDGMLPAEVEIYLGKESIAGPSRGEMEWEEGVETRQMSSEEETENSRELKRQKLDSGIGEGTTSSGASPDKSEGKTDESDADASHPTDSLTDSPMDEGIGIRGESGRRLQKRGRRQAGGPGSSSGDACDACDACDTCGTCDTCDEGEAGAGGAGGRRGKRRVPDSSDARRVRFSLVMKRAVRELPLPYALKKYVNLGRCFEF